jgi:hypothetical protein
MTATVLVGSPMDFKLGRSRYHKRMHWTGHSRRVTVAEARARGYTACLVCWPTARARRRRPPVGRRPARLGL